MSGDFNTHNNQQPHINYAGSKVDLDKYALFVDGVTSDPSKDYKSFLDSIEYLDGEGSNIQRLLTAAVRIISEGGEFMEIVKKMLFQGNPFWPGNSPSVSAVTSTICGGNGLGASLLL